MIRPAASRKRARTRLRRNRRRVVLETGMLHTLHTLSGWGIMGCFTAKLMLHFFLDHRQGSRLSLWMMVLAPLPYFKPYHTPVDLKLHALRVLCNFFWALTVFSLVVNVGVGVLMAVWGE